MYQGEQSQHQGNDTWLIKPVEYPLMLTEIASLLSSPEQYVCCYFNDSWFVVSSEANPAFCR